MARRVRGRSSSFVETFDAVVANVAEVVRGKDEVITLALECLIAGGHLLLEDVPGVGKTVLAKSLAASIDGSWSRIQFTPDLLPSDVTGSSVWDRHREEFRFVAGPIFHHLVLADEINRASPKTQAALLEAMEEGQVTADGTTMGLPLPFMVLATQNPIEYEGTFPLPEGQLDRFMARTSIGYPDVDTELDILERHLDDDVLPALEPVATIDDVMWLRDAARQVHVAPALRSYVVAIADASRRHPDLSVGISPRGSLAVLRLARVHAAAQSREFVVPDDIQDMLGPVLAHRVVVAAEADLAGAGAHDVLADVIGAVPVPTRRQESARAVAP